LDLLDFDLLMLLLLLVEENLQCNKLGVVSFDEIHLHLLDAIDIIYVVIVNSSMVEFSPLEL
jgi:hypothetical protein